MNCIPKSDASIGCSATANKKSLLMRWPCKGLHSCFVAQESPSGIRTCLRGGRPHQELVVIATGGQLRIVVAPLQSTNLLFVADQLRHSFSATAQVVIVNTSVLW